MGAGNTCVSKTDRNMSVGSGGQRPNDWGQGRAQSEVLGLLGGRQGQVMEAPVGSYSKHSGRPLRT